MKGETWEWLLSVFW